MEAHSESAQSKYKVVCTSHGIVQEQIEDEIAADLIAREHRETCPATVHHESYQYAEPEGPEGTFITAAERIQAENQRRHGNRGATAQEATDAEVKEAVEKLETDGDHVRNPGTGVTGP